MTSFILAPTLSGKWEPFTLAGKHLTFAQHVSARLDRANCSHWGCAVYKWEGPVLSGPNSGKTGVLIGETKDLRQRIKQYVSGTQERGNKLWRESFLSKGNVRLSILQINDLKFGNESDRSTISSSDALASNNIRLIIEQLLVLTETFKNDDTRWIVNARR